MAIIDTRQSTAVADGEVVTACASCAHPWGTHDRIAARFCNATAAGQYKRGCVCTTRVTVDPPA
jgi:hypothetical protein